MTEPPPTLMRQVRNILRRADDAARKIEAGYSRGEIAPRSEFDRLLEVEDEIRAVLHRLSAGELGELGEDAVALALCSASAVAPGEHPEK